MKPNGTVARKPKALRQGDRFSVFSPASPATSEDGAAGIAELKRLGFMPAETGALPVAPSEGYFAAPSGDRLQEFLLKTRAGGSEALIAMRGGYGSNYLLGAELEAHLAQNDPPKCLIGFSDLTSLQIFLWQRARWVTFYGPMVAAGFRQGADSSGGYELNSFLRAISHTETGWTVALRAESLLDGEAVGTVLGGCLTLLQATIGTSWELDTRGSILLLEDTGMRPYQVDRALMHLLQAKKFEGVRGIVLGEFPGGAASVPGSPTVREVCQRILAPLRIPVVYGAPVGHTERAMLTVPLGICAKLQASGEGTLDFLEAAVC